MALLLGLKVGDLPADHSGRPDGLDDHAEGLHLRGAVDLLFRKASDRPQAVRQEGVARQDRDGFAENYVAGRDPASQVVIVESRQVVVDQRIRVDHLEAARRGQGGRRLSADRLGGRQAEDRPKAFSSGEERMTDGAVKRLRPGRLRRQEAGELPVHFLLALGEECPRISRGRR